MRALFYISFTFCLLLQSIFSFAQNLNGEKIKVSPESITALKFNSTIMDYQWSDPSGYTCMARNNDNTLLIKTLNDHPKPTTLIVSEGKRTHYFIIDFVSKIDLNNTKLYYDYSDLKQLKKIVQNTKPVAENQPEEEKTKEEELSAKEKKRLAKEEEARKKEEEQKRKEQEAEREKLLAEQKQQAAKLKQQEQEAAAQKQQAEEEKQRLVDEQKKKEEEDRQRKEQERQNAIAQEQERMRQEKEKQAEIAAAQEAERKRKAEEEADRIKKLNDEKESAAAAAKEKARLEAERKKQLAEEKQHAKEEAERQKKLIALQEQQRKEETKQKELAKIAEQKRLKEEEERKKKEAEANKTEYTHVELWKKYPNIVFGDPPINQHLTGEYYMPADTMENHRVSEHLMQMDYWLNITSQSVNDVSITMQSLIFSGVNAYMRILIKNDNDKDFLTGKVNLRWIKKDGSVVDLFPCYVTGFPVVLPHKQKVMIYAARAVNADDNDNFVFSMMDRFEKTKLELSFSGKEYNLEMSK